MRENRKHGRIGFCCLFAAMLLSLSITGCSREDKEDIRRFQIYYIDRDGSGLVTEEYEIPMKGQNTVDIIQKLLQQLQTKGERGNHINPIQPEVEINDYLIKETLLSIYFTAAYNSKSGVDEILSRAAIVKTLCQLPEIDHVEFYVEDQPLMLSGNAVGQMNEDTFMDELDPEFKEQSKKVTLYYAREGEQKLMEVSMEVTYSTAQPLAQLLLDNLITVPEELSKMEQMRVISPIPQGTMVNSVTIRDNICYVDLSKEFLERLPDTNSDVTVFSIVNTLCELSNVSKVQFTIDGEPKQTYGETENFNKPYERNLDLVSGTADIWINNYTIEDQ